MMDDIKESSEDLDHKTLRSNIRRFLEKEAKPHFNLWEEQGQIPRGFWQQLGEMGYLGLGVPEAYGGSGLDFTFLAIFVEELERIGSSLNGISLHVGIVLPYLLRYGTDEQKQRWVPRCIAGDLVGAIAMTEPGTGSDLKAIQTRAERQDHYYRINGHKTFITNGHSADLIVVVCKTESLDDVKQSMSLIVVESDTPGFSKGRKLRKMGLWAEDTAELHFDGCMVSDTNVLGKPGQGFHYLSENLPQERLLVAVESLVAAEEILAMTLSYVQQRTVFGQPLSKFQNTRFKLAEVATEVAIAREFVGSLVSRHASGTISSEETAMAKWWVTEMAQHAAMECLQLFGGYGYMEEYPIARRYRDITVSKIYAGTNEIMKTIIAKSLGL